MFLVIVNLILAVSLAATRVSDEMRYFGESKPDVAQATAMKYVRFAYPEWSRWHPSEVCPTSIADLDVYLAKDHPYDPWGNVYEMTCSGRGMVVHSRGADKRANTSDDVWATYP